MVDLRSDALALRARAHGKANDCDAAMRTASVRSLATRATKSAERCDMEGGRKAADVRNVGRALELSHTLLNTRKERCSRSTRCRFQLGSQTRSHRMASTSLCSSTRQTWPSGIRMTATFQIGRSRVPCCCYRAHGVEHLANKKTAVPPVWMALVSGNSRTCDRPGAGRLTGPCRSIHVRSLHWLICDVGLGRAEPDRRARFQPRAV